VLALVDSLQARARLHGTTIAWLLYRARPAAPGSSPASAAGKAFAPDRRPCCPLTLELTAAERQLIISGPNTAGKNRHAETTALLAMMAQAESRAGRGSRFPVFTAFLADIGDAQSIEASFHLLRDITNLDRLSRLAGDRTLVLLDELAPPQTRGRLALAGRLPATFWRRGRGRDLDAPYFAQGLRGQHARSAQTPRPEWMSDAGAQLPTAAGSARRIGRHSDRRAAGAERGHHRRRPPKTGSQQVDIARSSTGCTRS